MEFKVGNRYGVLGGCETFKEGSEVELKRLESDGLHLYKLISGRCILSCLQPGEQGAYVLPHNVKPLEKIVSNDTTTDRSYQTRDELLEENKSLLRQVNSLISRKEALAIEVGSLGDRIKRKKAFRASNIKSLKSQSIGV